MSNLYAGTPALKTDFTRTGKRTYKGLANDGYHSLQRYVLNNFYDGRRQDSINLFLGEYVVDTIRSSPFAVAASTKTMVTYTYI